jgi:2-succinyl-5-enolpyruvyl-6-hydroxy-3-cyclohexene-1-carboxylate synthase
LDPASILDERSAAFAALGAARTLGEPVAIACTSGTAAANYAPAVHEASHARVPVIVLTADRPARLRGIASPQTIDQVGIYGSAPRWEIDVPVPEPTEAWMDQLVGLAERAWREAVVGQGPVHLNLQFDEPLGPTGREEGVPIAPREPEFVEERLAVELDGLAEALGPRPLVVAGDGSGGPGLTAIAETIPVLADPLVVERRPPALLRGNAFAASGLLGRLRPTGVLRLGGPPTSKALNRWLADHTATPQVLVDEIGRRDPTQSAMQQLRVDPEAAAFALDGWTAEAGWRASWESAEADVDASRGHLPYPSEPAVARIVSGAVGDRDLWVGSSMPIRDVDDFAGPIGGRIHGTRGANGIDGLISAAAGASLAARHPTVALLGDIALLHDVGGLLTARRLDVDLTIVVVDNDGGGIFSFLPQADADGPFDLLATPHGFDVTAIAEGTGAATAVPRTADELRTAVETADGVRVVVVRTDRDANRSLHRELADRAKAALA